MHPFHPRVVRPRLQVGMSNLQIMIGTLIGGILIMGGLVMLRQIDKAKVDNEVRELSRLKQKTANLAAQRGTLDGVTLQTLIARDFFSADKVTGPVGGRTVQNEWGGTVEVIPVSFGGPWNALVFRFRGVSAAACKQLGMQVGAVAPGIAVMDSWVKTIQPLGGTGSLILADLIARCDQGGNNVVIDFYLTK